MSTLYELTGIYKTIYEMEVDDETKADTLESIDWNEDFVAKVEGYVKVIKSLDNDEATIKDEIKRLQARLQAIDNKKTYLKDTLQMAMETTGNERVKTALFHVAVANSKASVVVDEEKLASRYMIKTVTIKPDKKQIYDLLKAGKRVNGASLKDNRSLRIR